MFPFVQTFSLPLLFAAYTVLSVSGMVLVKYAAPLLKSALAVGGSLMFPGMLVAAGAGMYVAGFALWMLILIRTPLTVAYPVAVGLTMAFSTVAAVALLGETLKWQTMVGSLLVFAGVVMLAR